jgi:hypothetical protein
MSGRKSHFFAPKVDLERLLDSFGGLRLMSESGGRQNFCVVEFDNHRDAALAKKRLVPEGTTVAGCRIKVDWSREDASFARPTTVSPRRLLFARPPVHGPRSFSAREVSVRPQPAPEFVQGGTLESLQRAVRR